jgi:hypothetical protein
MTTTATTTTAAAAQSITSTSFECAAAADPACYGDDDESSPPTRYFMLVQARAVSHWRTYGDTADDMETKEAEPIMITIPSSNVLLEKLSSTNESSSVYSSEQMTEATAPSSMRQRVSVRVAVPVMARRFRGRIVKDKNLRLPNSVLAFKQVRQARTAAAAVAGGVIVLTTLGPLGVAVGLVVLGPVGAVLGAVAAYGIAKRVGKAKEQKLIEKVGLLPLPEDEPALAVVARPA